MIWEEITLNKLFNRLIRGIIKIPTSKPIEILIVLIFLVVFYGGLKTQNYDIVWFVGINLVFYLIVKGRK